MGESIVKKLNLVDRFLTLWIFLAMAAGIALGYLQPQFAEWIGGWKVGSTSIPIAVGLILMMYPPLAKVRYEEMGKTFGNKKLLGLSMLMNWVVGPLLMTALAVLFLRHQPGLMIGVIMVGLARCIAMVIVWNDLAKGNRELGVGIVALNAIFQMLFYAVYIWLFITVFLTVTGLAKGVKAEISIWDSAKTVLVYLGIPFFAGLVTRFVLVRHKGREWYETKFTPRISPITFYALLFTIIVMFSLQGKTILQNPLSVLLVALPYLLYFAAMWFFTFFAAKKLGATYDDSTATAFSAASNDFELAIAASIAIFGITSPQAFASVIGPLIEVPAMVILVSVALRLKRGFAGARA